MSIDIDELLKILPQLVRENDTVKGAIITALSGVVATHEDIIALIQEMNQRFEAVDRRFEAVDTRFEQLIAEMNRRFDDMHADIGELRSAIGNLGDRSGRALEQTILELMNTLIVEKAGIDYRQVHREPIQDEEGEFFFPGFNTDVDVVAQDGEVHLFEVKYKADQADVAHFLKVAQLYEKVTQQTPAKLFVVTLEVTQQTLKATANLPVQIIAGSVTG